MDLFERLERTPGLLERIAADVPEAVMRTRSGPFAFVEHAWHLADLENDGFGQRIARILAEDDPFLPDFDGERIARERAYLTLPAAEGLAAFATARAANLQKLRRLADAQWSRGGRQEGVGPIALRDLPRRMLDHDLAHFAEIADLLADLVPAHPMLPELRALTLGGPTSSKAA